MNYKELIEKMTDDYIAVGKQWIGVGKWFIIDKDDLPSVRNEYIDFQAIHKRHKDILDAYLENNSVAIQSAVMPVDSSREWRTLNGFFIDGYREHLEYRLKPLSYETPLKEVTKEDFAKGNLYCVASEKHYKYLSSMGYINIFNDEKKCLQADYFVPNINSRASRKELIIGDYPNSIILGKRECPHQILKKHKGLIQIQLINNKWYFVEEEQDKLTKPIEESYKKEDLSSLLIYGFAGKKEVETISAPNSDLKFTSSLKVVLFEIVDNFIFGRVLYKGKWLPCKWDLDGNNKIGVGLMSDLVPLKKEWYDHIEWSKGVLIVDKDTDKIQGVGYSRYKNQIEDYRGNIIIEDITCDEWRLATKEERDSLFCGDSCER